MTTLMLFEQKLRHHERHTQTVIIVINQVIFKKTVVLDCRKKTVVSTSFTSNGYFRSRRGGFPLVEGKVHITQETFMDEEIIIMSNLEMIIMSNMGIVFIQL